ncbi:MAG: restriction endonuclease [Kiritimatiellaeota bacterium]|nr:restriction endonuclease [Kiritimatiellota bacterium]
MVKQKTEQPEPNRLYYGDNLEILRGEINDESVDLCYIDPPFNSKRNYNQIYNNIGKEDRAQAVAFTDTWEWDTAAEAGLAEILTNARGLFPAQVGALIIGLQKILGKGSLFAYLVSMTLRIAEIHRVLKPTGSFYLHCDPTASHYLKLVLDAVFCSRRGSFLNEIIWRYQTGGVSKRWFGRKHDIIFWYSKTNSYQFFPDNVRVPRTDEVIRRIKSGTPGATRATTLDKLPDDVFMIQALNAMDKERLGYPTQKPEALLEKLILASSDDGDVVLDAYCGCGTTVAVAQRLKRRWIGIDITYHSVSLIKKRLVESYGADILKSIVESGQPVDMESARALARRTDDRTRKEFEKWAVLTYSNNRAMINDKKGGDGGIDGRAYTADEKEILFSVKSGNVNPGMVRDLRGTIEREGAAAGIFITLQPPTKDMRKEAASAGFHESPYLANPIEKIKIVTIEELLAGARLEIPLVREAVKKAQATNVAEQLRLLE